MDFGHTQYACSSAPDRRVLQQRAVMSKDKKGRRGRSHDTQENRKESERPSRKIRDSVSSTMDLVSPKCLFARAFQGRGIVAAVDGSFVLRETDMTVLGEIWFHDVWTHCFPPSGNIPERDGYDEMERNMVWRAHRSPGTSLTGRKLAKTCTGPETLSGVSNISEISVASDWWGLPRARHLNFVLRETEMATQILRNCKEIG
ncbi:hypothetical protein B0H10DRAFT_1990962 [Mycena sp. CBHHK59/15]|nr:hypothetical protein B0H10DRAFT_1990962 [Mycena sp. CBHHK59/15]